MASKDFTNFYYLYVVEVSKFCCNFSETIVTAPWFPKVLCLFLDPETSSVLLIFFHPHRHPLHLPFRLLPLSCLLILRQASGLNVAVVDTAFSGDEQRCVSPLLVSTLERAFAIPQAFIQPSWTHAFPGFANVVMSCRCVCPKRALHTCPFLPTFSCRCFFFLVSPFLIVSEYFLKLFLFIYSV